MSRSSRPNSSSSPGLNASINGGGTGTTATNLSSSMRQNHGRQVEFVAPVLPGNPSVTEQKIVSAVRSLQTLVNQESKWRSRVITSVQTCGNIDLSAEKMNEYINKCRERINNLREEATKIADKQMHLVTFEPNVYKQWFEGLGSDPLSSVTPNPAVVVSCNQALSGSASGDKHGSSASKRGGSAGSASMRKSMNSNSGGGGGSNKKGNNANQNAPQQFLDGIPLPEKFWQRREQQRQALASVYLAIFDLPRLNRERSSSSSSSLLFGGINNNNNNNNNNKQNLTSAEMVYQLQEATRLSATSAQQLKELLREYRMREKDVQAGLFNAMINSNTAETANSSSGGGGGKGDGGRAASLRGKNPVSLSGGNTSARGRPGSSSTRGGGTRGGSGGDHGDGGGDAITMKMCLQTGIFIHDPNKDDLALSTDLRTGDFFDIGSPRCLDQRALHRVMTLRSRRLRLEECIAVFEEEKFQLSRRRDLQKEVTGLSQYALFATRPEIEKTVAEEKRLQKQKQEEIEAIKLAEKHGLLQLKRSITGTAAAGSSSKGGKTGSGVGDGTDEDNNAASGALSLDESSFMMENTTNLFGTTTTANRGKATSGQTSSNASPQARRR